ncbi:MAG: LysM peptidoglycan-binding domain-containing protein [Treponema sp.]|jgi:hypothetical protein|nr:LysM peptidoglycan-binding domain-containing protein [Treponema sp.]
MNKRIPIFLFIVVFTLTLIAACGGTPAPVPAEPVPAAAPPQPQTQPQPPAKEELVLDGAANHKVVFGDTLSGIAAKRYGNLFYFPLIRLANTGVVSDPDVLKPNTNLVIPDLQKNLDNAGARALLRADMLAIAAQYEMQGKPNSAAELRALADKISK